jgi:hypothetical protein
LYRSGREVPVTDERYTPFAKPQPPRAARASEPLWTLGKAERVITDRSLLVILDGSKALRKTVRATFGEAALVQRCQVHYADLRIMPMWLTEVRSTVGKFVDSHTLANAEQRLIPEFTWCATKAQRTNG